MKRYNETYTERLIFDSPGEQIEFTKQSKVFDPSYGLWLAGGAVGIDITLRGEIFTGGHGVYSAADTANITIAGTGVIRGETALRIDGADSSLENHGTIVGSGYGIVTDELSPEVINDGLISAPIGISLRATEGTLLVNERDGEIAGTSVGVIFTGSIATSTVKLINHGVITGPNTAIIGSASVDQLTNRGMIVGDVNLGDGDDRYDGRRGTIAGEIDGGFGDDAFLIDNGQVHIAEAQNQGMDRVYSSVSYWLPSNVEYLYLRGNKDLMGHGNDDDNALYGNSGNNVLDGHEGINYLSGGRGSDVLIGGSQRDIFDFNPGDGRDRITNFQDGVDQINLDEWRQFNSVEDILDHARERNGDVILSFGRDQLTIENVTKAQLDASDFPA